MHKPSLPRYVGPDVSGDGRKMTQERIKACLAADVEHIFSNYRREDSPLSLRQHLALLQRAGFSAADVLWKRFNFAVYVGVKFNGKEQQKWQR